MSSFNDDDTDSLSLDFVPADVKKEVEVHPAGWYRVRISKLAITVNGDEDIKTASIQLTITEGERERKKIFARHCIATTRAGDNMQTMQRIGREQLGELMRAAGVGGATLTPLLDCEVMVSLVVRPAKGTYDESNDVKGYKPVPGAVALKAGAPAASAPAPVKSAAPSFLKARKPVVIAPLPTDAELIALDKGLQPVGGEADGADDFVNG